MAMVLPFWAGDPSGAMSCGIKRESVHPFGFLSVYLSVYLSIYASKGMTVHPSPLPNSLQAYGAVQSGSKPL